MIAQVLNREFVLKHLNLVKKDLEQAAKEDQPVKGRRRGPGKPSFEVEKGDFENAIEHFSQIQISPPHGQPSFDAPPKTEGSGTPPQLEEYAFFCWDPTISLLQTALERYYVELAPKALERKTPPSGRRDASSQLIVSDVYIRGNEALNTPPRRILDKYSVADIRWLSCWVAEGIRLFRKKHEFKNSAAATFPIRNDARLIMVGDWGTGLPRAKAVAKQMRVEIDKGKTSGLEQHVIHLGDVYYSGWETEYRNQFLAKDCWPVRESEADTITSWSLNGNHDMYSGGHAYFDVLLADKRFKKQERSSFFQLSNDHWDILGLDTAWDDEDLKAPQSDWVMSKINGSTKNIMVLSHHQLFSVYESGCQKIAGKLQRALRTDHIRAWFWGHEHRCIIYDPSQNVPFARCIGHGGVPVYQYHTDPCPAPGQWEFRDYIKRGLEHWALFGFAVIDLSGPHASVRYIDENGNENHREVIG